MFVTVLIEKLLRSCKEIDTIYVLIRAKKGKDAASRLHTLLDDFVSIKQFKNILLVNRWRGT